ncbi:MAG TPA: ribose 5-phosphate isomerase B [Clostridia bacterium]|nr:ribose 5-phosphate isomerase B [Clostridia bacterium]
MKVALGCDHGGFVLKESVVNALNVFGAEIVDFGTNSTDSVDYPIYAKKVAEAVASGECECGVLLCGTGIGMSIAANKVKGIRAAVISDLFSAKATKEHNNANIITMGGRLVSPEYAAMILNEWLEAKYQGGRHQNRIDLIEQIENEYFK